MCIHQGRSRFCPFPKYTQCHGSMKCAPERRIGDPSNKKTTIVPCSMMRRDGNRLPSFSGMNTLNRDANEKQRGKKHRDELESD
jgi:hypothetical protein